MNAALYHIVSSCFVNLCKFQVENISIEYV